MTDPSAQMRATLPTAPPTAPTGPLIVHNDLWNRAVSLLLILAACCGLLVSAYWCYVVAVNMFTGSKAMWFWSDAIVRVALWILLAVAGCLIFDSRNRSGRRLLGFWAIAYLLWLPVSAIINANMGEPPPDIGLAVVISAMLMMMALPPPVAILFVAGCMWLFLPAVALIWLAWTTKSAR